MGNVQLLDYSVQLLQALLWQHNNATRLTALLQAKNEWYKTNVEDFWTAWQRDVFDMDTANAFGLQVWAIILGMPLFSIQPPTTKKNWGFGPAAFNFNNGNFGFMGSYQNELTTTDARLLLKLRYYSLITRPNMLEINEMLGRVFNGDLRVYSIDQMNMEAIAYVFSRDPGSRFIALLQYYNVMPRPATIGIRFEVVQRRAFGFGTPNLNFNRVNGSFGA